MIALFPLPLPPSPLPSPPRTQEAAWLSSLLPQLQEKGVPLYAILHEEKGAGKFGTFLEGGELFFDETVSFVVTKSREL